ncbi:DNA-formamidopyrimidine glycosylase [Streptococcus sp. zg-JUN1979]|uniref:DNA-formamidopyrimidine glycosylase n=1 Tax=Streptococcus sp. zg-JUN1979 TaxID=3391450 RepID=UPI0039A4D205
MPELPEVETVRRGLEHLIVGRRITDVIIKVPKMVKYDSQLFCESLIGQAFRAILRRGKYLLFELDEGVVVSHLRMEGKYHLFKDDVPQNKHFHLFFHLDDGSTLVYQDVRKFGTFEYLKKAELDAYFTKKKLGPEPTNHDFDEEAFRDALSRYRKPLKSLLLDQTLVVGLGNIYVDEVLWASQLHPQRAANSLSREEAHHLHEEIIRILQLAVDKGGSTIRTYKNALGKDGTMQNYLQVYGKTGEPCPRCASPIEKIKVGGRGTHFCPSCQKR